MDFNGCQSWNNDVRDALASAFASGNLLVGVYGADDTLRYASAAFKQLFELDSVDGTTTFDDLIRRGAARNCGPRIDCGDVTAFIVKTQKRRRQQPGQRCFSTDTLYQLVKKGSMNAPAEALTRFWATLREKSRVRIEHPDLPAELQSATGELAAALWTRAVDVAQDQLAAAQLEAQRSVADAQAQQAQAESGTRPGAPRTDWRCSGAGCGADPHHRTGPGAGHLRRRGVDAAGAGTTGATGRAAVAASARSRPT